MPPGAGAGIGRHAAETLASKGYLVLAGVRKQVDVDALLAAKVANLVPIQLDVTDKESIANAFEVVQKTITKKNLPFVALINNAGTLQVNPIELTEDKASRQIMDVNFFGVLDMSRQFIPLLRKFAGSRLINISSAKGIVSFAFNGLYCASKFALEALSDTMRRELEEFGIAVIVIQPAYINTKMSGVLLEDTSAITNDPIGMRYYKAKALTSLEKGKAATAVAPEPDDTSRVITEAVTSPKPYTRYMAGIIDEKKTPAVVLKWMAWLLPDRVLDLLA